MRLEELLGADLGGDNFRRSFRSAFPPGGDSGNLNAERNLVSFFERLLGIESVSTKNRDDEAFQKIEQITKQAEALAQQYDFINQLAAESGQTIEELLGGAVDSTNIEEFIASLRLSDDLEKQIANTIRQKIEVLNRELQIQRELFTATEQINAQMTQLRVTITAAQDAIVELTASRNALSSRPGATAIGLDRGQRLLQQAGRSSFNQGTDSFIRDFLDAITNRNQAVRDSQDARLSNKLSTDELLQKARAEATAQENFIRVQRIINERIAELGIRIQAASAAAQEFGKVFDDLNSGLINAGNSFQQFTAEGLSEGIRAFTIFNNAARLSSGQVGTRCWNRWGW